MARPKLHSTMMATTRCLLALCVLGLLFGSEVAAMRTSKQDSRAAGDMLTTGAISKGKPFTITGDVGALYPGVRAPLNVQITNPNNSPLTVRSIAVGVEDSNVVGCGREWISPGDDVKISALVPPKSTAHLSFPVRMMSSAPVACQGATWTLNFTGAGTVPDGQYPPDDDNDGDDDGDGTDQRPGGDDEYGSILPFTGFNLLMIAGIALSSILLGLLLVALRRSGDEA